jgi:multiple sugar transport system ATP-binding protein
MASLTLKGISKKFGDIVALSHVNIHVEDGEFCVLLGPSGCGKSTLLQIVAGLERQDRGAVLLDEEGVDHLSPRERDVAMVFQSYALYPHMTVSQNLSFGLRMRRFRKDEVQNKVSEAARLLGIEHLLDRKPRQLSGGQRQRVAMGRALVRRPTLFLLDEPLSNLDAQLRLNVRLELKRLHTKIGSTILYVTHDQVEAMTLGDKVVVLQEGKIHQVGPPETIYNRPANTFVATFVGSPVMNLFKGRITRKGESFAFHHSDFSLHVGSLPPHMEGCEVEVGIRPEDIEVRQEESDLRAEVEMLSNVGAEQYIHTKLGRAPLTLRAPKDATCRAGDMIPIHVDTRKLHFFFEGQRMN